MPVRREYLMSQQRHDMSLQPPDPASVGEHSTWTCASRNVYDGKLLTCTRAVRAVRLQVVHKIACFTGSFGKGDYNRQLLEGLAKRVDVAL